MSFHHDEILRRRVEIAHLRNSLYRREIVRTQCALAQGRQHAIMGGSNSEGGNTGKNDDAVERLVAAMERISDGLSCCKGDTMPRHLMQQTSATQKEAATKSPEVYNHCAAQSVSPKVDEQLHITPEQPASSAEGNEAIVRWSNDAVSPQEIDILGLLKQLDSSLASESGNSSDSAESADDESKPASVRPASDIKAKKRIRARSALVDMYARRPRSHWKRMGESEPEDWRILAGTNLFRAVVNAVIMAYVAPRSLALARHTRSRSQDAEECEAALAIYFERCRAWLVRSVRVPVNSCLTDSHVKLRMGDLGNDARRNMKSRILSVAKIGRSSPSSTPLSLVQLKVHIKGVVEGIVREPPPDDIMKLLLYLASDGVYFPSGWLYVAEKERLDLNDLGATRWMLLPVEGSPSSLPASRKGLAAEHPEKHPGHGRRRSSLPAPLQRLQTEKLPSLYKHEQSERWYDTSRIEMIVTNFLFVKLLVPWVLLYPWESGLSKGPNVSAAAAAHNCQVLASAFYLLLRTLRPELIAPGDADVSGEGDELEHSDDEGTSGGLPSKPRRGSWIPGAGSKKPPPRSLADVLREENFVSNVLIAAGLLPDSYFIAVRHELEFWMKELAKDLQKWIQEVVAGVVNEILSK